MTMDEDSNPLVLASDFPAVDEAAWRAAVDRALTRDPGTLSAQERDALFARKLVTRTYDGIAIRPLYTAHDARMTAPGGLPGAPPFLRGASAAGTTQDGWDVRSRVPLEGDGSRTNERVLAELEGGANSILLETGELPANPAVLERALKSVYLDLAAIALDSGPHAPAWAQALISVWERQGIADAAARGALGIDPIGELARSGDADALVPALQHAAQLARRCTGMPGVRALRVDATPYHEAGASDAEELGCALACGVEYVRQLTATGLDVDASLESLEFRFAATADQFLTIAKLRAARLAWDRVAEVLGARSDRPGQVQHAQSSRAMLTRYDPWVNLLRGTLACFSAGLGGATSITIDPFDAGSRGEPSALGVRMARNTGAILIEEAHTARVLDPAGGSWYVESLTAELAEQAWAVFQEIEGAGGLIEALQQGLVQARIAKTWASRSRNIARRRDAITGVSEFPNIAEEIPPAPAARPPRAAGRVTPLPVIRFAGAFETLRERADAAARRTGARPSIFLAALGSLAEHSPRVSFCKNLFEAGGIAALTPGTVDAAGVAEAFRASGAALACVCGTDERYAEQAADVVKALRSAGPRRLYLAGAVEPLRDALTRAGVEEFVVAGCDAIEVLERAQKACGVHDAV
jgi:methylmalonyl-CoA mutase